MRRTAQRLAAAISLAAVLGGCGEISNTITPNPGSANQIAVASSTGPSYALAGLYEARANDDFKQTDMDVSVVPASSGESALIELEQRKVLIALAAAPDVLLQRNSSHAVVAVAAILQTPQGPKVVCTQRTGTATTTSTVKTASGTTKSKRVRKSTVCAGAPGSTGPPAAYRGAPSYPG